jgi:serine/threonine protein kinase
LKAGDIFQKRYKILDQLGAGGMGTVYRALQLDANREVALKLLRQEQVTDEETLQRFYREFQILAQIHHQHIVTIYGLALDEDKTPYAICELIDGKTLRHRISESGTIDWQRAVHILSQMCDAMAYAHKLNIIHRDLKPENIMLLQIPEADYVKIIDFGLSRASIVELDESQRLTHTGQLLGTPSYMSPEQFNGPADVRSDIYALGCIAFELLSGEKLFETDNAIGTIYKHMKEDPVPRFKAITSRVPKALLEMLSSLLSKSANERPQSMLDVATTLKEIVARPENLMNGQEFINSNRADSARINPKLIFLLGVVALVTTTLFLFVHLQEQRRTALSREADAPSPALNLLQLFIHGKNQLLSGPHQNLAAAEKTYTEAIEKCNLKGRNANKAAACFALRARSEWLQDKTENAITDFAEARRIATKLKPDENCIKDICLEESRFHFHQKKFDLAIEELKNGVSALKVGSDTALLDFVQRMDIINKYLSTGIEAAGGSRTDLIQSFALEIKQSKPTSSQESIQIIKIAEILAQTMFKITNLHQGHIPDAIALQEFAVTLSQSLQGNESLKEKLKVELSKMKRSLKTGPPSK